MATIAVVVDVTSFPNTIVQSWSALNATDTTGAAASYPQFNDKTVTVNGTFDTGTLTMQGSNDGTNWFTLTDPAGNNVAFTAAGGKAIVENPLYIRPVLSGAGADSLNVVVAARAGSR